MLEKIERFQILLLALVLALGLVIATTIVSGALPNEGISVTGSASKVVKSDKGSLYFNIITRQKTRKIAYDVIKKQLPIVKSYLISKGIKEEDINIKTTNHYNTYRMLPNGNTSNDVEYYNVQQPIEIKSDNVELIKELSTDITSLMDKGIDLDVNSPEYYYSKISDLKVELLNEAAKDAKQRASAMLKATHNRTGKIQSVKMGVFQITSPDSTDVSDSGIFNTESIEKKVTAVANVIFKIK
ncbi:MAG: SIMPL domain-containing protein [Cyanobacteria bacterium RUI128]|nr:SIMPL domain-containing protein [Cyanobacteria bacterium RUI128]